MNTPYEALPNADSKLSTRVHAHARKMQEHETKNKMQKLNANPAEIDTCSPYAHISFPMHTRL